MLACKNGIVLSKPIIRLRIIEILREITTNQAKQSTGTVRTTCGHPYKSQFNKQSLQLNDSNAAIALTVLSDAEGLDAAVTAKSFPERFL